MELDYNSLLLAVGFSGVCLAATLFGSWASARSEGFMLTWSIGLLLIVSNVVVYSLYITSPNQALAVLTFALLMAGLSLVYAAAHQFCYNSRPYLRALRVFAPAFAVCLLPLALGYDGLAFAAYNLIAGVLLCMSAAVFWATRQQAPAAVAVLSILYALCGLSFVLCAIVIVAEGQFVLGHAPQNWAEYVNIVISVACMTGIGALSLSLNQTRLARRHETEAGTDPLSGLMNRRALFDRLEGRRLGSLVAVLAFDLDGFKKVNDTYGHAIGDEVIVQFAEILSRHALDGASAARLGGEEFVIVLPRALPEIAERIAESVRAELAGTFFQTHMGPLRCTVSVGIGYGLVEGAPFDAVLKQADDALYAAKEAGRNRVMSASRFRLVG